MLAEFDDFANKIRMRKRLLHSRIDPTSAIIESPLPANSPLEKFLAMSRFSLDEMLNKTTNSIKADIMSRQVRKAILSIKRNKEIVIKPSDKNLGVCIMDLNLSDMKIHQIIKEFLLHLKEFYSSTAFFTIRIAHLLL